MGAWVIPGMGRKALGLVPGSDLGRLPSLKLLQLKPPPLPSSLLHPFHPQIIGSRISVLGR